MMKRFPLIPVIFIIVIFKMAPVGLLPTPSFHPSFQWMKPLQEFYHQKKNILKKYQSESGEFEAITYNVAGLPQMISGSSPSKNMSLIAEKLSQFSLVFAQEDFWYHQILEDNLPLPFKLPPLKTSGLGDGLSQFSDKPLIPIIHVTWDACHGVLESGSDCLTPKGFSFSQMEIVPGLLVHTYNVHMDSGDSLGDQKIRVEQLQQLVQFIQSHSKETPIIIAGDFNIHFAFAVRAGKAGRFTADSGERPSSPEPPSLYSNFSTKRGEVTDQESTPDLIAFHDFLQKINLIDSCESLQCGDERLDRIVFRGNPQLKLAALSWTVPHHFFTKDGLALSDHDPVLVRFHYEKNASLRMPKILNSFKMPKLNRLNRQPHTALQDKHTP